MGHGFHSELLNNQRLNIIIISNDFFLRSYLEETVPRCSNLHHYFLKSKVIP
jgi:hypothetical protein